MLFNLNLDLDLKKSLVLREAPSLPRKDLGPNQNFNTTKLMARYSPWPKAARRRFHFRLTCIFRMDITLEEPSRLFFPAPAPIRQAADCIV